jgi:hypothetical protein
VATNKEAPVKHDTLNDSTQMRFRVVESELEKSRRKIAELEMVKESIGNQLNKCVADLKRTYEPMKTH